MADCRQMRDLISCYADGELSGPEKQTLEQHLKLCPSCRSVLSIYESISSSMDESMKEPPTDFTDSVMSAVKKLPEHNITSITQKSRKKAAKRIVISFAAAAACLTLVLVASPLFFGSRTASTKDASLSMQTSEDEAAFEMATESFDNALGSAMSDESFAAPEEADTENSVPDAVEAGDAPMLSDSSDTSTDHDGASTSESRADEDLLKEYYAVFYIDGTLPDTIEDEAVTWAEDGTEKIEISVQTAETLIYDGYKADMGNKDAEKALVVYTR